MMKKILTIAIATVALLSCKKEQTRDIITFSLPNLQFSAQGGTKDLEIMCEGDWQINYNKESWIKGVTPMSGSGNSKISITVDENVSGKTRIEELSFNSQPFVLFQEIGGQVEISKIYGVWVGKDGTMDFKFTFNSDLTCKSEMTRGNYEGTYTIDGNIIIITINDSGQKINVTINDIEGKKMLATVMGTSLELTKQ